jgi:hypothetical protein
MSDRRLRSAGPALSLSAALLLVASCRDATQITLHVHTDVPCASEDTWQGVAVYVGSPGEDTERTSATLVTRSCDERGVVGSLVVTPSGDKNGELGLRVVAGIRHAPEKCLENDYEGCVVTRRALRFSPHESLDLDIELAADCVSIGCDATHSCVAGRCVDARNTERALPEPEHSVRCGDDGVRCPTEGEVCCLSVDLEQQSSSGSCRRPAACDRPSVVLFCDDDSDCPEREPETGSPAVCLLSYSLSGPSDPWSPSAVAHASCRYASVAGLMGSNGLALCQEHKSCADGAFRCVESRGMPVNPLPKYLWCELHLP